MVVFFKSACFVILLAAAFEVGAVNDASGRNAVKNGDFAKWTSYTGKGITTTTKGVPIGSLPDDWYGGPGVGATAKCDRLEFGPRQTEVPGNPRYFLRVRWSQPPSQDWAGEDQHRPSFRFTFLEYFGIRDVRAFAGKTVLMSFYARVDRGALSVTPIMWHSYDATTPVKGKGYELFESSGSPNLVAVASGKPNPSAPCRVTTRWDRFERRITLPGAEGKTITPGHYTGAGFDLTSRFKGSIDIANVRVEELSD